MELSVLAIACALIAISIAPLFPSNHWLFRVWEFPRVQISALLVCIFLSMIVLGMYHSITEIIILSGVVISLIYQVIWIFPYTPLFRKQVREAKEVIENRCVSLMTSNVLMTNRNVEGLLELVNQYKPDLLVTLETNTWWQNQLSELEQEYRHCVKHPLENLYGMHLYSRLPISKIEVAELIEEGVPSIHCLVELRCGSIVQCHFLHPAPPSPTENSESTERDIELLHVAKRVSIRNVPTIVTGDLNDVAWSPTTRKFRKVSGLLDPRIGRGMFNTFHADFKFIRWPLDHLFHSENFELIELTRMPTIGSDHFPLYTKLQLKQ